jgi:hypothetical protein
MKPLATTAALCLFTCLFTACNEDASPTDPPLTGGFSEASVSDQEVKAAADFAVSTRAAEEKKKIELVSITAAEVQVVAGMNYKLTLEVLVDGKKQTAEALVWWQSWRQPDPYQLSSWTVK